MSKLPIVFCVPKSSVRWMAVLVWMIVILIFSTDYFSEARTTAPLFTSSTSSAIRKLAHLGEYFVLAVLLIRALNSRSVGLIPKRCILIAVIFAAVYAAIDEWHQSFVPSRDATTRDVLIDAIGAVCGGSLIYAYGAMKRVKTVHANTHRRT